MRPHWKHKNQAQWGGAFSAIVPMMFKSNRARVNHHWDILQIRQSKIPGRFILWMCIDSEAVLVPLRILHEFYIHLKKL